MEGGRAKEIEGEIKGFREKGKRGDTRRERKCERERWRYREKEGERDMERGQGNGKRGRQGESGKR